MTSYNPQYAKYLKNTSQKTPEKSTRKVFYIKDNPLAKDDKKPKDEDNSGE